MAAFHLIAGNDYTPGPYTVNFGAGQQNATLMVYTTDDNTTELSEYFKLVIYSTDQPSVVDIVSPTSTCITIEDNNPGMYAYFTLKMNETHVHTYVCILWLLISKLDVVCMHKYILYRSLHTERSSSLICTLLVQMCKCSLTLQATMFLKR